MNREKKGSVCRPGLRRPPRQERHKFSTLLVVHECRKGFKCDRKSIIINSMIMAVRKNYNICWLNLDGTQNEIERREKITII